MKYILLILFSLSGIMANASSEGFDNDDCVASNYLTQKQGNMTKVDLGNIKTLKPCSIVLDAKTLISNLSMVATKDDVIFFKKIIQAGTHEYQRIEDAMKDTNSISMIFEYLAYSIFTLIPFYIIALLVKNSAATPEQRASQNKKGVIIVLCLGLFSASIFNTSKIYTGITIGALGTLGYINYEQSDNDTFNDVRNADLSNISTAYSESNTKIITAIKYNSIQNTVTKFHFKEVLGGVVEIDATLLGDESDTNRPTEREFREYQKHCEKTFDYSVTDKEFSLLIAKFNYTNLPTKGNLLSGGDTSEFNCSKHFGKEGEVNAISITSNAIDTTDRFIMSLYDEDMSKDLNYLESIQSSLDSANGNANLILEKTAEIASKNVDVIPYQMDLALSAVKESSDTNTPIKETKAWVSLVDSQKQRMGNVFDNGDVEDMSVMQEMALNAIQGQYFKSATLFGYAPEDGEELDFIEDNFAIGFYYFSKFVNETSALVLELDCIKTDSKLYDERVKFAAYYNNPDYEQPHHLSNNFGANSGAHCFKYYEDRIVAGANPEDYESIKKEIRQRDKALSVFFDSMDSASLELIMSKPNLNDDILVDYLNTLDTSFQSTIDSFLVLTKVKQELMQIFNTVDDAFSIKYHMQAMVEDTNKPATYFNYARLYENVYQQDLDQIAEAKGLHFFDLSDYFQLSVQTFIASENERATEAQSVLNTLLKPRCPVKDEYGDCAANVAQILKSNYETMFSISESLTLYKLVIDGVDGACDVGSGSGAGGSFKMAAKANPYIAAICGLSGGLDTVNELVVAPAINIGWALTIFNKIGLLIPSLADLFLLLFSFVMLFVPVLMIPILLNIEMLRNLMFSFSDDPKSFDKMTDFDGTLNAIKILLVSSIAFCITAIIGIFLYTSSGLGGGLFDTLAGDNMEDTLINIIVSLLTVTIVFAVIAVKFIPQILGNVYDGIMQYMKIQSSKMSESSNAFTGFVMGYMVNKSMNHMNKAQNHSLGKTKSSLKNKASKYKNKLNANSVPTKKDKVNVDVVVDEDIKTPEKASEKVKEEVKPKSKAKPDIKTYEFEGDIGKMSKDELKDYEKGIIDTIDSDQKPKK